MCWTRLIDDLVVVHDLTDAVRLMSSLHTICTLCEWPLRQLLNENANMGVQNNYFVRKRPFSMGWNGGYGFKNYKKIKCRFLREKTTPLLHTGWP